MWPILEGILPGHQLCSEIPKSSSKPGVGYRENLLIVFITGLLGAQSALGSMAENEWSTWLLP